MSSEEREVVIDRTTTTTSDQSELESKPLPEETTSATQLDKSKSAEEIASMIAQQQQISLSKSNENLIVSSFVSFFDPLIQNLDANVQALRSVILSIVIVVELLET